MRKNVDKKKRNSLYVFCLLASINFISYKKKHPILREGWVLYTFELFKLFKQP